jgi:hypothetical protein
VIFLIPNTAIFNQSLDEPSFFTTSLYRRYLSRNEIVLPIPFGTGGPGLLWQASTHLYFRLASGHFYVPPDYGVQSFVSQALGPGPAKGAKAALRSFLASRHVAAIVVQADQSQGWAGVISRLGYPGISVGGVLFYRVSGA